jgi:hypothetical protein
MNIWPTTKRSEQTNKQTNKHVSKCMNTDERTQKGLDSEQANTGSPFLTLSPLGSYPPFGFWVRSRQTHWQHTAGLITETNRMQLVLPGMQNRTFGPYLAEPLFRLIGDAVGPPQNAEQDIWSLFGSH